MKGREGSHDQTKKIGGEVPETASLLGQSYIACQEYVIGYSPAKLNLRTESDGGTGIGAGAIPRYWLCKCISPASISADYITARVKRK
jgi:hypothetical protein